LSRLYLSAAVVAGVLVVACAALAQSAPDAPGKDRFTAICTGCHSLDQTIGQRKTREGWAEVVETMRGFGAQGTDEDFQKVVDYLANTYGLSPAAKPAPPSAK